MYLLLDEYPTWWAETEALRHWWTGERPIHLQHLQVEDRTDVQAVPKLLKTGDPRLVELGTLLYASVGTGLMYLDELDLECVVALVDQLEEYHSHYARAQAVRALACYVRRDGTYLLSHEHPELYHRARDLLYTLVRVSLRFDLTFSLFGPGPKSLGILTCPTRKPLIASIASELSYVRMASIPTIHSQCRMSCLVLSCFFRVYP